MRVIFRYLLMCIFLRTNLGASASHNNPLDKLGLHNNYNGIVRDLIKNWESPIVYLQQLGYLPKDYEDTSKIKPNLDALVSRMDLDDQRESLKEADKTKEQFCGTFDPEKLKVQKKREQILEYKAEKSERPQHTATVNQDNKYPSVDKMLAEKLPAKPLTMPDAAVGKIIAKTNPAAEHTNMQLLLLGHLMAQQQQEEQVHPQSETKPNFDDFLERLVAKTSPDAQIGQKEIPVTQLRSPVKLEMPGESAGKSLTESQQREQKEKSSLSTYGTLLKSLHKLATHTSPFSRQDQAQDKPEIEAPQYLTWDIQNNRLKQISPVAKDAYVEKLVQIFVKKQEKQEPQPQPQMQSYSH